MQTDPHPSKIKDFCHLPPGEGFGAVVIVGASIARPYRRITLHKVKPFADDQWSPLRYTDARSKKHVIPRERSDRGNLLAGIAILNILPGDCHAPAGLAMTTLIINYQFSTVHSPACGLLSFFVDTGRGMWYNFSVW